MKNLTCERLKILIKVVDDINKLKDHHIRIIFQFTHILRKYLESVLFIISYCEPTHFFRVHRQSLYRLFS